MRAEPLRRAGEGGAFLLGACAVLVLAGCRGQPHESPPIHPIRNMYQQPRYNPQAESAFFPDGRTMRPLVPGTVAREMEVDLTVATGLLEGPEPKWVPEVPQQVVRRFESPEAMVRHGRERFEIYCAPCHGATGQGDGPVARRAQQLGASVLKPPTLHSERLRHAPDGYVYAVITNGVRNMPAYRHSIPVQDRWAIVRYVRAMQLAMLGQKRAALFPSPRATEEQP